jgi:hypothetical protein
MQLKWTYDVANRLATTTITDNLYYTTPDGGQTINKYVDGVLVKSFHKYGEENKFTHVTDDTGHHMVVDSSQVDEWPEEVEWLARNHGDVVGELYSDWDKGFLNVNGDIDDVGKLRGFGITNPDDKISINRLCCPANEVEWWDWETIAMGPDVDDDCMDRGTWWRRNKKTGEIVRTSGQTPPYPCCVHPVVHGPYTVDESDIEKNNGVRIR